MKTKKFMTIEELKRIAEENNYELSDSLGQCKLKDKCSQNYIDINNLCVNRLWISIPAACDERDFNMIKASIKFAETPLDKREKKFYLSHRWENKQLSLKEIEEIKERYDTDLSDFAIIEVADEI